MAILVSEKGDVKFVPATPSFQSHGVMGYLEGGGNYGGTYGESYTDADGNTWQMPAGALVMSPGYKPPGSDSNGNGNGNGSGSGSGSGSGGGSGGGAGNGIDPQIQAYMDVSATYGFDYSMQQYQTLLDMRVSTEEWQQREAAAFYVKQNPDFVPAMQDVLKARGLLTGNLTAAQAAQIVARVGRADWTQVYDEFTGYADAINSGISIGKGGQFDISRQQLVGILHRTPGTNDFGDLAQPFQNLARDFQYVIPANKMVQLGITKDDLIALELGSDKPGYQQKVATKVNRIMATLQAAGNSRAMIRAQATQDGATVYGGFDQLAGQARL